MVLTDVSRSEYPVAMTSTTRPVEPEFPDTYRYLPSATKAVVDDLAKKINVSGSVLTAAVLAWDALKVLSAEDQRKALAVVVGLVAREELP